MLPDGTVEVRIVGEYEVDDNCWWKLESLFLTLTRVDRKADSGQKSFLEVHTIFIRLRYKRQKLKVFLKTQDIKAFFMRQLLMKFIINLSSATARSASTFGDWDSGSCGHYRWPWWWWWVVFCICVTFLQCVFLSVATMPTDDDVWSWRLAMLLKILNSGKLVNIKDAYHHPLFYKVVHTSSNIS